MYKLLFSFLQYSAAQQVFELMDVETVNNIPSIILDTGSKTLIFHHSAERIRETLIDVASICKGGRFLWREESRRAMVFLRLLNGKCV